MYVVCVTKLSCGIVFREEADVEMADSSYERVLSVKNEVFVYKIPARTSNRGYRYDFFADISILALICKCSMVYCGRI